MTVRERGVRWLEQPQEAVALRDGPWASNSIVWSAANPSADLGTRGNVPALVGNNVLRTGQDGVEVYHPSTVGSDALVWTAPGGATDGFAAVIRFRLESTSQTTLFNSANEVTTLGAVHIRTSFPNLQFISRDASVRFTSAGVSLVVGKWHTVAFRAGVFPKATVGRESARMWIDGQLVGAFNTGSGAAITLGDFAVACGRYATDTAQARAHSISLAAFAFDSASDEDLLRASSEPWAALFGERRIWVPVSVAGGDTYTDSITDSAAGTDAASSSLLALNSLSDSAAATDTVTGSTAATEPTTDSASGTDTASALLTVTQVIADAAAATDTTTDSATITESLSDSAAATDTATDAAALVEALSDSAATTDAAFAGAQEYTESLSDSAAVADDWTCAVSATEMLSDAAVVSDVLGSTAILSVLCEELAAGSDIVVVEGGIPVPTEIYARLASGDARRQRATRTNVQAARRTNVQAARRGN